ncbi:MAG: hypothetical protein ACE5IZ_08900 [Dehalococcoidia bacterium]
MGERQLYREDWLKLKREGQLEEALVALQENYATALDREDLFWADTFLQEMMEVLRLRGSTDPVTDVVDVVHRLKEDEPRLQRRSELVEQNLEDNIALIKAKSGTADRLRDMDKVPED